MSSGSTQSPKLTFEDVKERIARALEGLRFGTVELQIHDFRVVRITRTEQVRFDASREEKGRT